MEIIRRDRNYVTSRKELKPSPPPPERIETSGVADASVGLIRVSTGTGGENGGVSLHRTVRDRMRAEGPNLTAYDPNT